MEVVAVPDEIRGLDVTPAEVPVFFWAYRGHRRVVVAEWGELKVLGKRVFRRFRGGQGDWNNLQSTLLRLETPGRPAAAVMGEHKLGYIRPWVRSGQELSPDSEPALIARASRRGLHLISPLLVPSVEEGREFLRELRDHHGGSPKEWACYYGEFPSQPMDKLFMSGSAGVRTQLEHDLTQCFDAEGRARQAFTRPDVQIAS
jgi:hypothetical protein